MESQEIEVEIDKQYGSIVKYEPQSDIRYLKVEPFGSNNILISAGQEERIEFEIEEGFINFNQIWLEFKIDAVKLAGTNTNPAAFGTDFIAFPSTYQWLFNRVELMSHNEETLCDYENADIFSKNLPLFMKKDNRAENDLLYFESKRTVQNTLFTGGAVVNPLAVILEDPYYYINALPIGSIENEENYLTVGQVAITYPEYNVINVRLADLFPQTIFSSDVFIWSSRSIFLNLYTNESTTFEHIGITEAGAIGVTTTTALDFNVDFTLANLTLCINTENNHEIEERLIKQETGKELEMVYSQIICNSINPNGGTQQSSSIRLISPYENSKLHSVYYMLREEDIVPTQGNIYLSGGSLQNTSLVTNGGVETVLNAKLSINNELVQPFIDYASYDHYEIIKEGFDHGFSSYNEYLDGCGSLAINFGDKIINNIVENNLEGLDFVNGEINLEFEFNTININLTHYCFAKILSLLFWSNGVPSLIPYNVE